MKRMGSGKFTMRRSNFFVLVLRERRRDGGSRLVGVVTVVRVVTMMNMIAALGMVIVFASSPSVGGVMSHPRVGDRGWIRGGRARGISTVSSMTPVEWGGRCSSEARHLQSSPCGGGFRGSGIVW
jgi:hypothetical protein